MSAHDRGSTRLVKRHGTERSFALSVRGDSMTDDGIDTGNLVVVSRYSVFMIETKNMKGY